MEVGDDMVAVTEMREDDIDRKYIMYFCNTRVLTKLSCQNLRDGEQIIEHDKFKK